VAALGNISELGSDLDRNCFVYPQLTSQRRLVLRIVRLAETKNNISVLLRLLGYPVDLRNLIRKRPPAGNTRPEGIYNSSCEKRRRGELGVIY
jgi:hypothetical protein